VDIKDLKVEEKFNDAYFQRPAKQKKKADPEQLFAQEKEVVLSGFA
jgi:hypothetical protein